MLEHVAIDRIVADIEEKLHNVSAGASDYKAKARSILFNLKDEKNEELFQVQFHAVMDKKNLCLNSNICFLHGWLSH